jgi:putative ABC transport system permease protein
MTFTVMISYLFTAILSDTRIVTKIGTQSGIIGTLTIGRFIILSFVLWFMWSANRFFIEQRQREFAVYRLFGSTKKQIGASYVLEIMLMAIIALFSGIILGTIFSKLLFMVLIKAIGGTTTSQIFISSQAISSTIVIFIILIGLIGLQSLWILRKQDMLQLFSNHEKPIIQRLRLKKRHWLAAFVSVVSLALGYGGIIFFVPLFKLLLHVMRLEWAIVLPVLSIIFLCILAVVAFYAGFLKILYTKIERRSRRHQIYLGTSRLLLAKEWRFLALVTLILTMVLVGVGSIASYASVRVNQFQQDYPVDFYVTTGESPQFEALLAKENVLAQQATLHYKLVGSYQPAYLLDGSDISDTRTVNLLAWSDYAAYAKLDAKIPQLAAATGVNSYLFSSEGSLFSDFSKSANWFALNNQKIKIVNRFNNYFGEAELNYFEDVLVVPDAVFQQATGITYTVEAYKYLTASKKDGQQIAAKWQQSTTTSWLQPISYDLTYQKQLSGYLRESKKSDDVKNYRLSSSSRVDTLKNVRLEIGIVLYVFFFVAVTVIIGTTTLVSLKLLSVTDEQRHNYDLLQQLGVSKDKRRFLVYRENAAFFAPPMLFALLHTVVAIFFYHRILHTEVYLFPILFCGGLVLVYVAFYLMVNAYYRRLLETN